MKTIEKENKPLYREDYLELEGIDPNKEEVNLW